MKSYRLISIASLITALVGCGGVKTAPAPVVGPGNIPASTTALTHKTQPTVSVLTPPPEINSPTSIAPPKPAPSNSAVLALLSDADKYRKQENYQAAQGSLQRAQRIAPQDPEVYYELAQAHLLLQDYSLAEQVALKGVSVSQGRPAQLKRFWNLIGDIRLQAGNTKGAEQAQQKAATY